MKLKRILCMLAVLVALSTAVICTASAAGDAAKKEVAENETEMLKPSAVSAGNSKDIPLAEPAAEKTDKKDVVLDDAVEKLGLKNPCVVDENGNVALSSDELIDLVLPKVLGGKALTSISAKSFAGCPYIRSVVVPESVLEIGEDAFANCKFLETIYVIGHGEDDMKLGANWNGNAEVVYVVDEADENAPAQDDVEETDKQQDADKAPSNEQPSGTEDAKPADTSETTNENTGTEEKAPAAESGSGEEKGADTAQQADDGSSSSPSNDAGKAAPQDDGGENTGAGDAETPTEDAETTEA